MTLNAFLQSYYERKRSNFKQYFFIKLIISIKFIDMSINSINYKKNKMIFSELIGENYKIKKDSHDKNTLLIYSNNKEIKCKCIMFMIEKNINEKNKESLILWSDSNPYIDQYTREISEIIRISLQREKSYLLNQNNQIITKNDLLDLMNNLIKNQYNFLDKYGKSINCNWVLTYEQNQMREYYMISDIIYY